VAQNPHIWQNWADALHRWGMHNVVAVLLEGTGPLNFIGAQAIYLGQPILNTILPEDHVNAFADLLNNPDDVKAFTQILRRSQGVD
jgi:hypothetical protein